MKKLLFLFLFIFIISGCQSREDAAVQSKKEIGTQEAQREQIIISDEGLSLVPGEEEKKAVSEAFEAGQHAVGEDAFLLPEENEKAATQEVLNVEARVVTEAEKAMSSDSAEAIIAENRWGFSVHDPQTGIIEYYTSTGNFLGTKKQG